MKANYALTDDVNTPIGIGPPVTKRVIIGAVTWCGDVVGKCVVPDINNLVRVAGYGDSPTACTGHTAGNAEVLQPSLDKRQNLALTRRRLDVERIIGNKLDKLFLVATESEKPVILLNHLRNDAVLRASAVGEFVRRIE